jgi:uncharacterized protein (DUF433 family)
MATTLDAMLVRTPGVCGGRLCIAGHRITVNHIAVMFKQGLNAEEIGAQYPHVSLGKIHAALAYYLENRDEVDRELDEMDAEFDSLKEAALDAKLEAACVAANQDKALEREIDEWQSFNDETAE